MKPTVCLFVVLVCILVNNIECITTCADRQYYSEDVPGCVACPQAKCEDQYPLDTQRCQVACGKCHFEVFKSVETDKIKLILSLVHYIELYCLLIF